MGKVVYKEPLHYKKHRDAMLHTLADKRLQPGRRIITGKDRRLFVPSTRRSTSIREQGRVIKHQIGTIVSISESKIYCVSTDNESPWHTQEEFIEKVLGAPVMLQDVVRYLYSKADINPTRKQNYLMRIVLYWEELGLRRSFNELIDNYKTEDKARQFCDMLYELLFKDE